MKSMAMVTLALLALLLAAEAAPPAVLWYAPFLSGGGYCSEAHSYVSAVSAALKQQAKAGDPSAASSSGLELIQEQRFSLLVTQHGDSLNPGFIRDMTDDMRAVMKEHWVEERDFHWRLKDRKIALAICHSEPGAWDPPQYHTSRCPPKGAALKVGRTMFETDRVPSGWSKRMLKMDEIWVPTMFQFHIFALDGLHPEMMKVVPEAVDVHFFDPSKVDKPYDLASELEHEITDKTTVFLSIFKWEERKAWRVLLKAYFQEFTREDDVLLVLLTNAYHVATESARDFLDVIEDFTMEAVGKKLDELPRLHVLPPHVPQDEMPSLYKAATAFVLPSRGEGWGRPHVEAMAMELPIIATFWSGTTEYMTEANSYPLNINGLIEIPEGAFRGHMWADPSVEHLQELMRRVKTHPEEAVAKGKQARKDMVEKYSPEVIGKIVFDHITRILEIVATPAEDDELDDSAPPLGDHEEL